MLKRIFTSCLVLSLLASSISATDAAASLRTSIGTHPTGSAIDLHARFQQESLSALAGFFTWSEERLNSKASVHALAWVVGLLITASADPAWAFHAEIAKGSPLSLYPRLFSATVVACVSIVAHFSLSRVRSFDRFAMDRSKQRLLKRRHRLFKDQHIVKWKDDGKNDHQLSVKFDFAVVNERTVEEMYHVVMNFYDKVLVKNEKLTSNQIALLETYRSRPIRLKRIIRHALLATPWAIVTRDPSGRIVGFVFPAFHPIAPEKQEPQDLAKNLAPTMDEMISWHTPFSELTDEELANLLMADYWVMAFDFKETGGSQEIVNTLLDQTEKMAQLLGVRYMVAYSNPVGYSTFSLKHPDIGIENYLARVVALPVMRNLIANKEIASMEELQREIRSLTANHVIGDSTVHFADMIIEGISKFATQEELSDHSSQEDLYSFSLKFAQPFDKGGFVLNEPALGIHLKRKAKVAQFFKGAFHSIFGGPGIGGGTSVPCCMRWLPCLTQRKCPIVQNQSG